MEYQETELIDKLESTFWWHQHLYNRIYKSINNLFLNDKTIYILDCGCGSGGLLNYLKNKGFYNIYGYDVSTIATQICIDKNLNVIQDDHINIDKIHSEIEKFDVIIGLDSLYFLDGKNKPLFINKLKERTKDKNYLIVNMPAFNIFSGNHDRIAQITHRYTNTRFLEEFNLNNKQVILNSYWPLFLSPVILFTRIIQKIIIKLKPRQKIKSDVSDLPYWINKILKYICDLEIILIKKSPFGSSLFGIYKIK